MAFFVKSKHNKIFAFTVAVLVVVGGLTSFGLSQEKTRNFMMEEVIRLSLSQCYEAPTEGVVEGDEILLQVTLNEHGTMALIPELLTTEDLTEGELALAREANVALFLCIPITSANRSKAIHGEFTLAVSYDGIEVSKVEASIIDLLVPFDTVASFDDIEDTTSEVEEVASIPDMEVVVSPVVEVIPDVEETPDVEVIIEADEVAEATVIDDTSEEETPVVVADEEIAEPVEETTVVASTDLMTTTATQEIEEQLELSRTEKRSIQRRLVLAGYNTRGVDGVFGRGSRAAISAWQGDGRMPVSGFLNRGQIVLLKAQTEDALVAWNKRPQRYFDRNGCLREPNGAIVSGRSFSCDLSAAGQELGIVK